MDDATRRMLHDLARECGGFVIKQNGVVVSTWIWDYESDKPKRAD